MIQIAHYWPSEVIKKLDHMHPVGFCMPENTELVRLFVCQIYLESDRVKIIKEAQELADRRCCVILSGTGKEIDFDGPKKRAVEIGEHAWVHYPIRKKGLHGSTQHIVVKCWNMPRQQWVALKQFRYKVSYDSEAFVKLEEKVFAWCNTHRKAIKSMTAAVCPDLQWFVKETT